MSHGLKSRYLALGVFLLIAQSCQFSQDVARQQEAATQHAALGLAYLERGERVMAKKHLALALKEAPTSAKVNTSMAYLMEQTGDLKQADKLYRNALRLAPRQGEYLNNYGAFLCRRGHYQQATHYFALAMQDAYYEQTALVYENAGICALAAGNPSHAKVYFKKALRHDPSRRLALIKLQDLQTTLKSGGNWE